MKKIITVVGARPQFIKAAPLSAVLTGRFNERMVHTGQHYDEAMSERFFTDLGIPAPAYNLQVGSASHGVQTARMLMGIEEIILKERPDGVLVYGDTNSTLAGALTAVKLHVPVFHVEAGLRSFNRKMPEEHNRVLTDHVSSLLFCPTETACMNLAREGITDGVLNVGDIMADSVRRFSSAGGAVGPDIHEGDVLQGSVGLLNLALAEGEYCLSTIHRAESTDDAGVLEGILNQLGSCGETVVLAAHPRLQQHLKNRRLPQNLFVIKPQGYLQMLALMKGARAVITDSGGLQKEAYMLQKKCVTLRSETEWIETLENQWNVLVPPGTGGPEALVHALQIEPGAWQPLYGDGHAAERIVEAMETWFMKN